MTINQVINKQNVDHYHFFLSCLLFLLKYFSGFASKNIQKMKFYFSKIELKNTEFQSYHKQIDPLGPIYLFIKSGNLFNKKKNTFKLDNLINSYFINLISFL